MEMQLSPFLVCNFRYFYYATNTEDEACHFRVRFIMQEKVQLIIQRFLLGSVIRISVEMQRQSGDGFGKDPHAAVHRCHLHCRPFIDWLPGSRTTKEKPPGTSGGRVLGLVSGLKQSTEYAHVFSPPLKMRKKKAPAV